MSDNPRDLRVGDKLRSMDPRDKGRTVRVVEVHPGRVHVERIGNGRRSILKASLNRWTVVERTLDER